ncbi:MAG: hypothetical protein JRF15_10510, partial [Deltaproteobacteria bacterium]|nr:hypothetical protein [Deltaproteobacteria bacterium]
MRCRKRERLETPTISRRAFLRALAGGAVLISPGLLSRRGLSAGTAEAMPAIGAARPGEDVFGFIRRARGRHDAKLLAQILGAANEFKDGDA